MIIDTGYFPADTPAIHVLIMVLIADSHAEAVTEHRAAEYLGILPRDAALAISALAKQGHVFRRANTDMGHDLYSLTSDGHTFLDQIEVH